jgi:hypothetical protein
MLERIGAAVFEWIIGGTLDNARLELGRKRCLRNLDRVVREAVAAAVTEVAGDPAVQEPLSAASWSVFGPSLTRGRTLGDPAACVRRWLVPLNEPTIGRRCRWQHLGLDRDSVVDAIAAKVLRGMTGGGSFELRSSGRAISGLRFLVCAGASP